MMNYLKFAKLARRRKIGFKKNNFRNYFRFQEFQAKEVIRELQRHNLDLSELKVLELAVGLGGYSRIIKKNCKEIIINELSKPEVLKLDPSIKFSAFDATKKYPFPDNSFDLVFTSSLIEHVENPKAMLSEIHRVLKPGGYLYLSFPPFYSPVGGHIFKPFHYFGENISVKIANFIHKTNIKSYATRYSGEHGTFGLHIRTIKGVKKLLSRQFTIRDYWTRFSPINFAKIPVLGEFLTWHVSFLGRKER